MSCGAPLPGEAGGAACARCAVDDAAIVQVRTALIYEYPVDQLVTQAKFVPSPECARALGELLAMYLRAARLRGGLALPDAVVPVPLHPRRLARRGFNQAEEIAIPIVRAFGLPLWRGACRRIVNTRAQTALSAGARRRNLGGAFEAGAGLGGRSVALVDDVLTTGSTVRAAARALRGAGVNSVEAWTVARSSGQASGRNV